MKKALPLTRRKRKPKPRSHNQSQGPAQSWGDLGQHIAKRSQKIGRQNLQLRIDTAYNLAVHLGYKRSKVEFCLDGLGKYWVCEYDGWQLEFWMEECYATKNYYRNTQGPFPVLDDRRITYLRAGETPEEFIRHLDGITQRKQKDSPQVKI